MARKAKEVIKAVAYMRTSSLANVGVDKDSDTRQRTAISQYARLSGHAVAEADWFYDAAVSGADPIEARPGFRALLDRIDGNGVRVVLIDEPSRFARDLMTQELGIALMIRRGVKVICANGDDLTVTDDPMRKAMRQFAGVFSELEKARLVAKLKSGREKKRADTGRCEGRKPISETHPEAVSLAKRLRRANPVTGKRRSLRTIALLLAEEGYLNERGLIFNPKSVLAMIES